MKIMNQLTKNNQFNLRRPALFGLLFLFLLLTSSCALKYMPVPDQDLIISGETAVWKNNDILFSVSEKMWLKDPQYLSDHYTTFWVKIQNNSSQTIQIKRSDFALLDESRSQTDAQDSEEVLDLMLQDESLYIDRFIMTIQSQQEKLQRRSTIQRNITLDSFAFGDILPRASKQGIIYFPKVSGRSKQLTLVYKQKEIIFQKIKN